MICQIYLFAQSATRNLIQIIRIVKRDIMTMMKMITEITDGMYLLNALFANAIFGKKYGTMGLEIKIIK